MIETIKNVYGHMFAQDREPILKAMTQQVWRAMASARGLASALAAAPTLQA